MSGLRIGDRVRTPDGVEEVSGYDRSGTVWTESDDGGITKRYEGDVRALPRAIPRERVADLLAAVTKRLAMLDPRATATMSDVYAFAHSELSEVAESLRLLLEVSDGE
jgi:hypothetical protein